MLKKLAGILVLLGFCHGLLISEELLYPLRTHKFDMKRIDFGMTYETVYQRENEERHFVSGSRGKDTLSLRFLSYYGVHMDLSYHFRDEKLVFVLYTNSRYHYLSERVKKELSQLHESNLNFLKKNGHLYLETPTRCQEDFMKVQKGLEMDFGTPILSDIKWTDGKDRGDPMKIKDFETFMKVRIDYAWKLSNGVIISHILFPHSGHISHIVKFNL